MERSENEYVHIDILNTEIADLEVIFLYLNNFLTSTVNGLLGLD